MSNKSVFLSTDKIDKAIQKYNEEEKQKEQVED